MYRSTHTNKQTNTHTHTRPLQPRSHHWGTTCASSSAPHVTYSFPHSSAGHKMYYSSWTEASTRRREGPPLLWSPGAIVPLSLTFTGVQLQEPALNITSRQGGVDPRGQSSAPTLWPTTPPPPPPPPPTAVCDRRCAISRTFSPRPHYRRQPGLLKWNLIGPTLFLPVCLLNNQFVYESLKSKQHVCLICRCGWSVCFGETEQYK